MWAKFLKKDFYKGSINKLAIVTIFSLNIMTSGLARLTAAVLPSLSAWIREFI